MSKNKKLACEFLYFYSRFEFALKAAGFIEHRNSGDAVFADWRKFAKEIGKKKKITQIESPEFQKSLKYFLCSPPKKQIFKNGGLEWKEVGVQELPTDFEKLLTLVCRVRNNFFHGGKFQSGPAYGSERDEKLIRGSLVILNECLPLSAKVKYIFEKEQNPWRNVAK